MVRIERLNNLHVYLVHIYYFLRLLSKFKPFLQSFVEDLLSIFHESILLYLSADFDELLEESLEKSTSKDFRRDVLISSFRFRPTCTIRMISLSGHKIILANLELANLDTLIENY